MSNEVKPIYEFGRFRLDLQKKLLSRDGVPIKLSGKRLQVLTFLIENRTVLISKETLLEKFWPSPKASESNLTDAIHRIRQALGETAKDSEYIFNLSGEGYQFVAEVIAEVNIVDSPTIVEKASGQIQKTEQMQSTADPISPDDSTLIFDGVVETTQVLSIQEKRTRCLHKIINLMRPIRSLIMTY